MKSIRLTERDIRSIIRKKLQEQNDTDIWAQPEIETDDLATYWNNVRHVAVVKILQPGTGSGGSAALEPQALNYIKSTIKDIISHPPLELKKIEITGHTDSEGDDEENIQVGMAYAQLLKSAIEGDEDLVQDPPYVIEVESFGEERPIDTNRTAGGRANNNRVQVKFEIEETEDESEILNVHNVGDVIDGTDPVTMGDSPWGSNTPTVQIDSLERVVSSLHLQSAIWINIPETAVNLIKTGQMHPAWRREGQKWIYSSAFTVEQVKEIAGESHEAEIDDAVTDTIMFVRSQNINRKIFPGTSELVLLKRQTDIWRVVGGIDNEEMKTVIQHWLDDEEGVYAYGLPGDNMNTLTEMYGPGPEELEPPEDRVESLGQEQPDIRDEPTRLFTVQNRGGEEIFTIRMPASFVNNADGGAWSENPSGWIDDIFAPDVLNDFLNLSGKTNLGDTNFRLSWNKFNNSKQNGLHFIVDAEILDIESIEYDEARPFRRLPNSDGYDGALRRAFNIVRALRNDGDRRMRSSEPGEEARGRTDKRVADSLMSAMRASTYDELKIKTRSGEDISLWRWTPRNLGNDGITDRQMQRIEDMYMASQEPDSVNETAKDLVNIVKKINELVTARSYSDTRPWDARRRFRRTPESQPDNMSGWSAQNRRLALMLGVGGAAYILSDPDANTVVPVVVDGDIRLSERVGTQRDGYRHGGDDIAVPIGTMVIASAAGDVERVTKPTEPWEAGVNNPNANRGGCSVLMSHTIDGTKVYTYYGHLSRIFVTEGESGLNMGAVIGETGGAARTPCGGNTTGPHLHFEIRDSSNNSILDPAVYDQWYNDASTLEITEVPDSSATQPTSGSRRPGGRPDRVRLPWEGGEVE